MTIYSLDVLLLLFGTSLFFHVWFNCCFLICIQFSQEAGRWSGISISLRIFQFVVMHTVKDFSIVNEAEVDVFMELSCFFSKRQWHPTPVLLPGESQGRWSLVGCRLWGSHRVGHDWRDFAAAAACFFYDPVDVGNLICGSPAFSKSSLNIWKFLVHILLKPHLKDFEHYLVSMWKSAIVQ